ncbi:hypothetical protein CDAR_20601 [Caerostris darwini]|uniref:Uncharacterized protein n=1 Tax=Caerostris darwini TaxID=1538125 RepID=A0AAV4QGY2_9ARAC|nr:hypothetical protein CDAR_20601 [Caerostris darwini]
MTPGGAKALRISRLEIPLFNLNIVQLIMHAVIEVQLQSKAEDRPDYVRSVPLMNKALGHPTCAFIASHEWFHFSMDSIKGTASADDAIGRERLR